MLLLYSRRFSLIDGENTKYTSKNLTLPELFRRTLFYWRSF